MEDWKETVPEEVLKDLEDGMSLRAIGRKHSINYSTLYSKLNKAGLLQKKKKMVLKATSTLFDEQGKVKLQWVKEDKAKEDVLQSFKDALEVLTSDKRVTSPFSIERPSDADMDTMSVYTIGDAHIGMLATASETGQVNNLQTTQEDLLKAMDLLVEQSHSSETAMLVDVGDWFHSDNANNRTAHSGNALDVDGRYPDVLEIGLQLTTKLIDKALAKHQNVIWRSAIGNHNEHSALMMTAFIKAWYRNEPRVNVKDTPAMFDYTVFGKNLIGVTHGHTAKAEKLGEIMSVDCKTVWGETDYRYWYTGHIHHQTIKEFSNCVVETFCTLSGKDAWHSASGYRSNQSMKCITLHKEYGEISRNTVSLKQVRA